MKSDFTNKSLFFPEKLVLITILVGLTAAPALLLAIEVTQAERQSVSDPPVETESPELKQAKEAALKSMAKLKQVVAQAKERGIETLYDEIPLMLGKLAFDVRWQIVEHKPLRMGYAEYVHDKCQRAIGHLRDVMAGQSADLKVPPHPDFANLKLQGAYYCENGQPRLLFSMQYHRTGELIKWFCPGNYAAGLPAVGASRYNFKNTPIWEAYQKYPETHRVYDNGWCGHIIRDKWSLGGSDICVISLDSPKMQEAIAKSIETYAQKINQRRTAPLYLNMGFEYSYVNYEKYSLDKFRTWLKNKYISIGKLNAAWKTELESFANVDLPPHSPGKHATNPAKYYDWGDFNLWRFTDYMVWAKQQMRRHIPEIPTTTGGGNPFGATFWKQGIDEEFLANAGVCDIWLSETGSRAQGVTNVMDLQRSLKPGQLILDPEYHALANTCFLMFLHGCGVMDYWWWPDDRNQFYAASMKHSHNRTLLDVETVMRTALDVRRLPRYIAAFPAATPKLVLLYPRATLIQKFQSAKGHETPFSIETVKCYAAAARLDTPVGFVSSKQVLDETLKNYDVLAITGARYVKADVFARILEFVKAGGTLIITPTSLIADEYSRRRNYLSQLGIEILSEELPEFMAAEAKPGTDQGQGELDFIQGPIAKTLITKEPKRRIIISDNTKLAAIQPKLAAAGVLQTVKASPAWRILARYALQNDPADNPAILVRSLGSGSIYYLAAQLEPNDQRTFFDYIMNEEELNRPIRAFAADGSYLNGVESRTVEFEDRYLTYLHNINAEPVDVVLKSDKQISSIYNLNKGVMLDSQSITLGPQETLIMKIEMR